jgi:poly(rC)-binding protein 2/3/4
MASNNSGSSVTLRMIIPGKEIGVIIGKGGETINQIRQDSQAKIFITDASVPERVITVTGKIFMKIVIPVYCKTLKYIQ